MIQKPGNKTVGPSWPDPVYTLTLKHRETHVCVVSTVATDALVLKHQAISSHSADLTFIVLDQFSYKNIAHKVNSIRKWNHILKKMTQSFKG